MEDYSNYYQQNEAKAKKGGILSLCFVALKNRIRIYKFLFKKDTKRMVFKATRTTALVLVAVVVAISGLFNMQPKEAKAMQGPQSQGRGSLVYSDNSTTPKKRGWSSGATSFGAQGSAATSRNPYQVVVKASPARPDERLSAITDNAGNLEVQRSTDGGTSWTVSLTAATVGAIGGTGTTRRFDLAYEQQSGEAILIYSKNATTNELGVRRWDGSTWSSESTFDPGGTANVVTWIEIAERNFSDELAVAYITNGATNNIGAAIWNGSTNALGNATGGTFGTCDSTAAAGDSKCFDINYESSTGRPVMSWGVSGGGNAADTLRASRWDGSSWTTAVISTGAAGEDGTTMDCESNPMTLSNEIACASIGNGSDDSQTWTLKYVGSSGTGCGTGTNAANYTCVANPSIDTAVHTDAAGQLMAAITYVVSGTSYRAIGVFSDGADDGALDSATFNGSTWATGTLTQTAAAVNEENIIGIYNPANQGEAVFLYSDTNSDLWGTRVTFDGTTVSSAAVDGGTAFTATLSGITNIPFDFTYEPIKERSKLSQTGYNWEYSDGGEVSSQSTVRTASSAFNDGEEVGPISWANTGNIAANDGSYTTVNISGCTSAKTLHINFNNASVPSDATITGVEVYIESFASVSGEVVIQTASLADTDLELGDNKALLNQEPSNVTFGGSTDTWGLSLTPSNINNYNFAYQIVAGPSCTVGATISADYATMTVYYTAGDGYSAAAAGNTSITGVRKGEQLNLRTQIKNTGGPVDLDNLSMFYDRNDGIWSKVGPANKPITGAGTGCDTGANNEGWSCYDIESTNIVGADSSMAIDQQGRPWVSYYDDTNDDLRVAKFVGTGGTGCASSAWNCMTIDSTNLVGKYTSLAFDRTGKPWISYLDVTNEDLKVAQYVGSGGTGCAVTSWTCTTVHSALKVGYYTSLAFDATNTPWIVYYYLDSVTLTEVGVWVTKYVGSGGTGCAVTSWSCYSLEIWGGYSGGAPDQSASIVFDTTNRPVISYYDFQSTLLINNLKVARLTGRELSGACGGANWTCETVAATGTVGKYSSVAIDAGGTPWVAYSDASGVSIAQYVGSSGSGCNVATWTCTNIVNSSGGRDVSLAFSPSGTQWISYDKGNDLGVMKYVGSGGSGCTSSAWTCSNIEVTNTIGADNSLVFDEQGNPWVSYFDSTNSNMRIARLQRVGEIIMTASKVASGTSIIESHADMTTISDAANRDDADCIGGGTWNNGIQTSSAALNTLPLPGGSGTAQCTEVIFTIDTSQALAGVTYRFVIAADDTFNQSKNFWRGPTSISYYPTLTLRSSDIDSVRYGKGAMYLPSGTCANTSGTSCINIDNDTDDTGYYQSAAYDPEGVLWVSYRDETATSLMVAKYVGSGGSGCGASGSTAWTCTVVDNDTDNTGNGNSIAFDANGTPWISYSDDTASSVMVAKYVGSGGSGCGASGSTAWTCTVVDNDTDSTGGNTSIAFDKSNTPWISYSDSTTTGLMVAKYVGSGGSGCGASGSTAWTCTLVNDVTGVGNNTYAISRGGVLVDNDNNIIVPYAFYTNGIGGDYYGFARYVGSGGSGCGANGSTAWSCTNIVVLVGDGAAAINPVNNQPEMIYDDGTYLMHASYVGSGGTGCYSAIYSCIDIDTKLTSNGGYSGVDLAFTPDGGYVAAYHDTSAIDDYGQFNLLTPSGETVIEDNFIVYSGVTTTIAVDKLGNPTLTYYWQPTTSLKLYTPTSMSGKLVSESIGGEYGLYGQTSYGNYRLTPGRSPIAGADGSCNSAADNTGYCGLYHNDGYYDSLTVRANERAAYTMAWKYDNNAEAPSVAWSGRTTLAPSTSGAAGDIVLQIYRFGVTNAWEDIASDTTSSCTTDNCTLQGTASGTASEYFDSDGAGGYWVYYRVVQKESTSTSFTFKVDSFKAEQTQKLMRGGRFVRDGQKSPLNW